MQFNPETSVHYNALSDCLCRGQSYIHASERLYAGTFWDGIVWNFDQTYSPRTSRHHGINGTPEISLQYSTEGGIKWGPIMPRGVRLSDGR